MQRVRLLADIPPRGRWVLFGCLVCQMGLGASYVFGPMLKSIVADLGWSRAGFSAGRGPLILAMSLSFPLVGALADRFGPRRVLSASVISMALAFFLMSRMDQRWEFYLINALLGLSLAGLGDILAVVGPDALRCQAGAALVCLHLQGHSRTAPLGQEIEAFSHPVHAGHERVHEQQQGEVVLHHFQIPGNRIACECRQHGGRQQRHHSSTWRMARNASCGTSTEPICFILFLPAFCFSRSLRLRVMSPP